MEKLTQPYLRCSLCTIEESEPWLMSGLKLSPFLPANCIPLPWSRSFIGGTSFKECSLVKNTGLVHFKYISSSPMAASATFLQQLEVFRMVLLGVPWHRPPSKQQHPFSRNFSPCLQCAIILAGDVQVIRSPRAVSDTSTND